VEEPLPEPPHKNPVLQPHSEEISSLTEVEEPLPEPPHKNPVLQSHSEEISGLTEEGEHLPEPPEPCTSASLRRYFRSY
jgi:hypothetical protein